MIKEFNKQFILSTNNTSYAFGVTKIGHLEHYYYGAKIRIEKEEDFSLLKEKIEFGPGNGLSYNEDNFNTALEINNMEASFVGKSDIREPLIGVVRTDGTTTCDFLYDSFELTKGSEEMKTLPGSYDESNEVDHLKITMVDHVYGMKLELHYLVYEKADVITRRIRIINDTKENVKLTRVMSMLMDMAEDDLTMHTFNGAWAREMVRTETRIKAGKHVNSSFTGTSSSRANPFVMFSRPNCGEDQGECFGFNLIYSGNHYEAAEVNSHNKTRISIGINPEHFMYTLMRGDEFESPEAVMTYSGKGFNGMSQNMHYFVREHIVRGEWKYKTRPVLLNSWEANYFDINEHKLTKLGKAAKDVGIEMLVMDDGWFGERDDDTTSLGDWDVNPKKLPNGLKGICDKINKLGLDFGVWVEPEMVNVKSKLYESHPEWTLEVPGKPHSEGRNQRMLDLTNNEVQDFIIEKMTEVFSSANIAYVKWDMNRILSDYYSQNLKPDKQGEMAHRYYIGLYRVMKELTARFPHILFEGCSSGGNRFDLGILCYFPQIWASDNTDAISRIEIQNGYSYGYPMSTVSAHVSACPNHQTLRVTPLDTRFNVAAFGVFGYECNLVDMKSEEIDDIRAQVAVYKQWRETLQWGNFYRGRFGNLTEWTCVSKDKTKAVGMICQKLVAPNSQYEFYKAKGLDDNKRYHFYNIKGKYNVKEFGDLINTVSPVHIKQDSLAHNIIAKFVNMDGEVENHEAYGDVLNNHGVKLCPAYGGTGYNDKVRHFQDFSSRMYFMEEV